MGAVSRDDGFMRVLISLGLSLLFPKASFSSSRRGLFKAIWLEFCLIGGEVEVSRVSDIKRECGGCLAGGGGSFQYLNLGLVRAERVVWYMRGVSQRPSD